MKSILLTVCLSAAFVAPVGAQNVTKDHIHYFSPLPIGIVTYQDRVISKHRITMLLVNPSPEPVDCNVWAEPVQDGSNWWGQFNRWPYTIPANGFRRLELPYNFEYREAWAQVLCNGTRTNPEGEIYATAQYENLTADNVVKSSVDLHSILWRGSSDILLVYPPNTQWTYLLIGAQSWGNFSLAAGFMFKIQVTLDNGIVLTKTDVPSFGRDGTFNAFFIENLFWPDIPYRGSPVSVRIQAYAWRTRAFDSTEKFRMSAIWYNNSTGTYTEATAFQFDDQVIAP